MHPCAVEKKTSVRSVPRDPLAAKRQTVHPNNQRKKTLRRLFLCHRGLTALQRTPTSVVPNGMDMLPIVTAFKSTSSGHHSPSLELSLGRSSPSLEMSYCGASSGRRRYTPTFWHTEQAGRFTEKQPFHIRVEISVRFVPKDPFVAKRQTVLASHPNNQGLDPLRLGDLHGKVSETSRKNVPVRFNHEPGGSGGNISLSVRFVDSSSSTSSPWYDDTSKERTPNRWSPVAHFVRSLFSSSSQVPTHFPFGRRLWESSVDVSFWLCNLLEGDQYASTAETFSVSLTLPSPFAILCFVTRFSDDFLVVPDVQAAQFSILTYHRFVTSGMMDSSLGLLGHVTV